MPWRGILTHEAARSGCSACSAPRRASAEFLVRHPEQLAALRDPLEAPLDRGEVRRAC